jgi:glycosyltransferase involved in cell wall biosynthesis
MKIIFDLRKVGLGNNGGSSTLIKSGNTLVDMGHDVLFLDSGKNQHTWSPLKAKHMIFRSNEKVPSADAIIATGYKSVATTCSSPDRFGLKLHWIRGWEIWQMPEEQIVKQILHAPTIKLVNSICLQNKLKTYNVKSKIIRPGYDLNDLYFDNSRSNLPPLILGGLCTQDKHEHIKRPSWIFKTYNQLKKEGYDVKLWMFGNESQPKKYVDKYLQRPSMIEKNWFYNHINIWLAPAMLEGLHMPPAEAMMTQCPVVSTNASMSGTQDYMDHETNGLVSENNIESFISSVKFLCSHHSKRSEMGKQARRTIENIGDRTKNMQYLVDYIMDKITD